MVVLQLLPEPVEKVEHAALFDLDCVAFASDAGEGTALTNPHEDGNRDGQRQEDGIHEVFHEMPAPGALSVSRLCLQFQSQEFDDIAKATPVFLIRRDERLVGVEDEFGVLGLVQGGAGERLCEILRDEFALP